MRLVLLLLILTMVGWISLPSFAQNPERCSTMEMLEVYLQQDPKLAERMLDVHQSILEIVGENPYRRSVPVISVPVVFHVIHNGESIGTGANISEAQILSQLAVLNEDFRRLNPDSLNTLAQFASVAADTKIEFCLAITDPNGNPTSGIVRHNFGASSYSTSTIDNTIKPAVNWNRDSYLNFYIANLTSGLLGYATFPGGSASVDGVVCGYKYVGRFPHNPNLNSFNLGRTATHEVGHWLGLYHTFQGGCGTSCASSGDYICDTPPVDNPNYGCPTVHASCGNLDMVQNYMDYSDDICMNLFSMGQSDRMRAVLNSSRSSIQNSIGCQIPNDPPTAEFDADKTNGCPGVTVQFNDLSTANPNGWLWLFPGGSPSTSTSQNPVVIYTASGLYSVTLTSTNVFGSDVIVKNNFISVSTSGIAGPVIESFESGFVPPIGWNIDNPDAAETWKSKSGITGAAGNLTTAAMIENYIYNGGGTEDHLVLPVIDLTTATASDLQFDVAYAPYSSSFSDGLRIDISTDCGQSFIPTSYNKSGSTLATTSNITTNWSPSSALHWRGEALDLTPYIGSSIVIRFAGINGYGNNIFIDNIEVNANSVVPCAAPVNLQVAVNSSNSITLQWDAVQGATAYKIQGRPLNYNGWISLMIGGSQSTLTLNNLGANYYEWKIQTLCGVDASAFSPTQQFDLGCVYPDVVATTNVSATSATLNWSNMPGADRYIIQGRLAGSPYWITLQVLAPATSWSVSNLTPGTSYDWKIRTVCDDNAGVISAFSAIQTFTTNNLTSRSNKNLPQTEIGLHSFHVSAYPNPVTSHLTLRVDASESAHFQYALMDLSGRIILEGVDHFTQSSSLTIPMGDVSTGVYLLHVFSDQDARTIKIIKN